MHQYSILTIGHEGGHSPLWWATSVGGAAAAGGAAGFFFGAAGAGGAAGAPGDVSAAGSLPSVQQPSPHDGRQILQDITYS